MLSEITNRRNVAIGGQASSNAGRLQYRPRANITDIAWHYTAVPRSWGRTIEDHERYWRDTFGWNRGGYHFYIDAHGNIFQNYNLTTVSNGVGGQNLYIVNICVEANSANDYSPAQIRARQRLTLWLMGLLNIPASRVKQHKEFPNQTTECAGYTTAQMNEFRRQLARGEVTSATGSTQPTTANESIVDYMNRNKMDSSLKNRTALANKFGIKNFTGSAEQNIELLGILKGDIMPKVKVGWVKDQDGWWYREADGTYPIEEWKKINGKWYYFENTGYMKTGWIELGETWYHLADSGAMETGWIRPAKSYYFMNTNGAMQTGWLYHNDKYYYLNTSGRMQTGLIKVGSKHYYLNQDGSLLVNDTIVLTANKNGELF